MAVVIDERPLVLPFIYAYDPARPDRIWLHGTARNGLLGRIAAGAPV